MCVWLTTTRLLGQQERGGEGSRERARTEEGWDPEEGVQPVLEGLWRGDSGNWRGCGGRCALVHSVCTVGSNPGGDLIRVRGSVFSRQ